MSMSTAQPLREHIVSEKVVLFRYLCTNLVGPFNVQQEGLRQFRLYLRIFAA